MLIIIFSPIATQVSTSIVQFRQKNKEISIKSTNFAILELKSKISSLNAKIMTLQGTYEYPALNPNYSCPERYFSTSTAAKAPSPTAVAT